MNLNLPDHVTRLDLDEPLAFACHPGVSCFTECCRELELALTPYDVLRLKNELRLTAGDFLEQHVVTEQEPGRFPALYLGMVDDGRASCPFVCETGCRVYGNRPGACRTYPVGRAAFHSRCKGNQEFHVLVREPHCQGFQEASSQTAAQWLMGQGVAEYNRFNDEVMGLLQHPKIKQGFQLSQEQVDSYLLALYNLDSFRTHINTPRIVEQFSLTAGEKEALTVDDEALLLFGVRWLKNTLFGE